MFSPGILSVKYHLNVLYKAIALRRFRIWLWIIILLIKRIFCYFVRIVIKILQGLLNILILNKQQKPLLSLTHWWRARRRFYQQTDQHKIIACNNAILPLLRNLAYNCFMSKVLKLLCQILDEYWLNCIFKAASVEQLHPLFKLSIGYKFSFALYSTSTNHNILQQNIISSSF